MADDVEVMSGEEEAGDVEACVVVSESTISTTDTVIDVVSTDEKGEHHAGTQGDGRVAMEDDGDGQVQHCSTSNGSLNADGQPCDVDSSYSVQQAPENLVIDKTKSLQNESGCHVMTTQSSEITTVSETKCASHSDNESEIIVDDSPSPAVDTNKKDDCLGGSLLDRDTQIFGNGDTGLRFLGRSRSVTPSPSIVRLATPNTPGTPRVRSGSVSGTTYAPLSPKPSPSARATPGERQRAGSMGEIEIRDKLLGREFKQGIRIIDNLDILQLPRPRNPGGILPLNGHILFNDSNEALNLTIEDRQQPKPSAGNIQSVSTSFSPIFPSVSKSNAAEKRSSTSYLISNIIRTTPNKQKASSNVTASSLSSVAGRSRGCAINESVERPLPSSVVDSEGVAKKIARLDSEGFMCSSTGDLWNSSGMVASSDDLLSRVRVISDKTPPERPKPPRRAVPSPADNDRSFVSSSIRRRLSPAHVNPTALRNGASNNGYGNGSTCVYRTTSPDSEICQVSHHYSCRICNFSTSSYNQLQLHSTKHGGNGKMFRCSLCDYSTYDKTNFRRHRRLHHKTSPGNVLKCVKCAYVTSLSRKLREHYQQAHPDMPDLAHLSVMPSLPRVSPQRFVGSHGYPVENSRNFPAHVYESPLMAGRNSRLGFPFSITSRQTPMNLPIDQFDVPYSSYRERLDDNLASNYIQPFLSSVMNSESRQAPTSTVTSSDYYMPGVVENVHPIQDIHTCNRHGSCNGVHSEVKIKIETDAENGCDISSTANQAANLSMPDITKNLSDSHTYTGSKLSHSTINVGSSLQLTPASRQCGDNDIYSSRNSSIPTDLTSPHKHATISDIVSTSGVAHIGVDHENGSSIHHDTNVESPPPSNIVIKSDRTTRGIQCVLPVIKTEIDLDGDYFDFSGRPRFRGIDRAVQCNLSNFNSTSTSRSQCHTARTALRSQSVSESDGSEHHSSVCGESRCEYCGITFDDEVLFSIHIGCHSHTDAFKCNVCGKQCSNKYGFYSHIMRGHQL